MKFKKPTKEDKKEALILMLIIFGALLVFGIILIVDKINSDRAMKEYMDKALFNNGGTKLSDITEQFKSEHPLPSSDPAIEEEKANVHKALTQELGYYKSKLNNGAPLTLTEISSAKAYTELAARTIIEEHNKSLEILGTDLPSDPFVRGILDSQVKILAHLAKLENGAEVTEEETAQCVRELEFLIKLLET